MGHHHKVIGVGILAWAPAAVPSFIILPCQLRQYLHSENNRGGSSTPTPGHTGAHHQGLLPSHTTDARDIGWDIWEVICPMKNSTAGGLCDHHGGLSRGCVRGQHSRVRLQVWRPLGQARTPRETRGHD